MISIVDNNRAILQNPLGDRVWSGWIIQGLNSSILNLPIQDDENKDIINQPFRCNRNGCTSQGKTRKSILKIYISRLFIYRNCIFLEDRTGWSRSQYSLGCSLHFHSTFSISYFRKVRFYRIRWHICTSPLLPYTSVGFHTV